MSFTDSHMPPLDFRCRCEAVEIPRLQICHYRMLIRNDEARIEHLTQWVNSLQPGDYAPFNPDLSQRLDAAHASLVRHSFELQKLYRQQSLQPA